MTMNFEAFLVNIDYHLAISDLNTQIFAVEMIVDLSNSTQDSLKLALPAWIPGSYMIRDFAKYIISFDCTDEQKNRLSWHKTDKQTWQINTSQNCKQLHVCYRVFANDLSVRSAFMCDQYAFANPTSLFMRVLDHETTAINLQIKQQNVPNDWDCICSLPSSENALPVDTIFAGECKRYFELIEHPIYIGKAQRTTFDTAGCRYHLVLSGDNAIDIDRIAEDLAQVCLHHTKFFRNVPNKEYYFITLLTENSYGGLEHTSSTALMFPRFDLPQIGDNADKTDAYIRFLSLCSHEYFHTWHVKQSKPTLLLAPDLSREQYTPQLWIYEGFTSYFDDLTLLRTGLIDEQSYLRILEDNINRLLANPGRHLQSVAESSYDAWTKFYQQTADSTNHIVSYYNKGALIALCLDIMLYSRSQQKYRLEDLTRAIWLHFGKTLKGTPDDVVEKLALEEFGIDISDFIRNYVHSTTELPLASFLRELGVEMTLSSIAFEGKSADFAALGCKAESYQSGYQLKQVINGGIAQRAGLMRGDLIIAIDGYHATENALKRLLPSLTQRDLSISLIRDGRLVERQLCWFDAGLMRATLSLREAQAFAAWREASSIGE